MMIARSTFLVASICVSDIPFAAGMEQQLPEQAREARAVKEEKRKKVVKLGRELNGDVVLVGADNIFQYLNTTAVEKFDSLKSLDKFGPIFHELLVNGIRQHDEAHAVVEAAIARKEEFERETMQPYCLHRTILDGDAEKVQRLLLAKNETRQHSLMQMSKLFLRSPLRNTMLLRDGVRPIDLIELPPLHIAVVAGRPDIVELLLNEPKTNVNQVSTYNGRSTPLHCAVLDTGVPAPVRTAMVKLLLAPRPNAKGTPIDVTLLTGTDNPNLCQSMESQINSANKTALQLAQDRGLHDIVQLLTKHAN